MDINIQAVLTSNETTVDDICNLLCNYKNLTEEQKDAFFEHRHSCNAFGSFWEHPDLLVRVFSVSDIDDDVIYLFEEHFSASDFTYHQAVTIMKQLLVHEDMFHASVLDETLQSILKDCSCKDDELTADDVWQLIAWFKKYSETNQTHMLCFLAWLLNSKKFTPEEVKAFCDDEYMPSYEEVEDLW